MDSKTVEYLSKLMLEDDEDDIVRFAFPSQKKKVKCSISMLADISPVFATMFSTRWCQEKVEENQLDGSVDSVLQDKIIQLSDDVNFDQHFTFKLLMQILYGLRKTDSLTVDQATDVYYYSDKYQIKDISEKIQQFLNERMESGMSKLPLSVTELTESIGFAQMYHLDEFKNKLDKVKLAFDEDNPTQFWDLTTQFEMKNLQQQVLDHVKNIAPKEDWPLDMSLAIVRSLQADKESVKKAMKELENCQCSQAYSLYCRYCRDYSIINVSSVLEKL